MHQLEQYVVTKSNELIEARYSLSTFESRIILTLASKVQPMDNEFKRYTFTVQEFAQLLGLKGKSIYEDMQNITSNLLKKTFTIVKQGASPGTGSKLQLSWLASAEYFEGKGIIELEFSPKLKPYFLQLKERFTSYKLSHIVKLKSSHSFRIYELVKQYESLEKRIFGFEELKELLGMEQNEYPNYGNFKQKVLLVSQREIGEKTDLSFDFEEIKSSRKVEKIKFIIYSNREKIINLPDTRQQIEQNLEKVYGLKPSHIQKILKTYALDDIQNNLLVVNENMYLRKIQNVPAFTQMALKENYAKSFSEFELNCLRKLETIEDKDRYYSIKKLYQKETAEMMQHALNVLSRSGTMENRLNAFMNRHPEHQRVNAKDLLDFSTPVGQKFAQFVFVENYPEFTFEYFYNHYKDMVVEEEPRYMIDVAIAAEDEHSVDVKRKVRYTGTQKRGIPNNSEQYEWDTIQNS